MDTNDTNLTRVVSITFGRNVAGSPLPVEAWEAFQRQVQEAVGRYVEALHFDGAFVTVNGNLGVGFWYENGERVEEDNCTFSVNFPALPPSGLDPEAQRLWVEAATRRYGWAVRVLADEIAHSAFDFGQETFSLVEGFGILVPGHEDEVRKHAQAGAADLEAFLAGIADERTFDGPCGQPGCEADGPHSHLAP